MTINEGYEKVQRTRARRTQQYEVEERTTEGERSKKEVAALESCRIVLKMMRFVVIWSIVALLFIVWGTNEPVG